MSNRDRQWRYGFFFSSRRRHTRCGRDWSSDVCSSDLAQEGLLRYQNVAEQPFLRNVVVEGRLDSRQLDVVLPQARAVVRSLHGQYKLINEIGRASCRERV